MALSIQILRLVISIHTKLLCVHISKSKRRVYFRRMKNIYKVKQLGTFLLFATLCCNTIEAQTWEENTKAYASDALEEALLGDEMAIWDNYSAVGGNYEGRDESGENVLSRAGAVYVFKKDGETWSETQKIAAPNREEFDEFGTAIAMHEDLLIIGAPGRNLNDEVSKQIGKGGVVFVYQRDNDGSYQFIAELASNVRERQDKFGISVATNGDFIFVGADGNRTDENNENSRSFTGATFVFAKNDQNQWIQTQKLVPFKRGFSGSENFGNTLTASDSFVAIGSPLYDSEEGTLYVFKYADSSQRWEEYQQITPPIWFLGGQAFTKSLSMDNENIVVGAPNYKYNFDELDKGCVYTYYLNKTENQFVLGAQIRLNDIDERAFFGFDVSLSNSFFSASLPGEGEGAVLTFRKNGTSWVLVSRVSSDETTSSKNFGRSTAMFNEDIVIGAFNDDLVDDQNNTLRSTGSIYFYSPSTPLGISALDQKKSDVMAYPNPFSKSLKVRLNSNQQFNSIEISTMAGRVIFNQNYAEVLEATIEPNLKPGIYTIKIYKDNELKGIKKVCRY